MPSPILLSILLTILICANAAYYVPDVQQFIYNGFKDAGLVLSGPASITQDGILSLSNGGRGFHPEILLRYPDLDGSFSATFVFTKSPYFSNSSGDEMAFLISSSTDFSGSFPRPYVGSSGYQEDTFFAIVLCSYFDNPICIISSSGGSCFANKLSSFLPDYEHEAPAMQLWVDYDGVSMELNVTVGPVSSTHEHSSPAMSYIADLTSRPPVPWFGSQTPLYVGLSSSVGDNNAGDITHQVLGWSFSLGGPPVLPLNYSLLPLKGEEESKKTMKNLVRWLPATAAVVSVLAVCLVLRWRRNRSAEAREEGWEADLGPRRFSCRVLRKATNGFNSKQLLGQGGFGSVYRGELATSGGTSTSIAVKRISSESKQGLAQFMAEVVILGRLRHRNLVRLIGYCRHKEDELLLVYEHMPNGSLDRYLHVFGKDTLVWSQRLHIIKGVAAGLLYLHEDWEQVIVHRDVKASNVLLDGEMNGRLGDFGLARLHDHGVDAHTTHVAGTRGYLAPELLRLGRATKATDVFAFGAFILEVACGRRPLGLNARGELLVLVDWVREVWASCCIVDVMDPRLEDYAADEAGLVLKLGLLCSHPLPAARPGMRLVMEYLDGDLPLPEFSQDYLDLKDADQVLETSPSVATTVTSMSGGR